MWSQNRHKSLSHWKEVFFSLFAAQEKDTFFLWIPVFLGIGVAIYFGMTTEPPIWIGLTCLVISGATTYYFKNYYFVFLSTLIASIVFAGFISGQLRTYYLSTSMLPTSFGPAGIQGRIAKIQETAKGTKVTLENLQIAGLRADRVPTRLRLHVNTLKTQVKTGQWVRTHAMLKPAPAPSSPGAFDFQRHAYFQQIGAIGFTYGDLQVIGKDQVNADSFPFFEDLRKVIRERIEQVLPNGDTSALAIAFLTGNKQLLSEETYEKVRAAGLAHLLAISGLHIGLVCMISFFSLRFILAHIPAIALRYNIKKWSAVFALGSTLFFTFLTGGSIPTIRAFIMCAIALVGILLDRKAISLRSVAWAAILILLIYPESLLGASFQLSFAAVTALVAFYEIYRENYEQNRFIRFFKGIITSSAIATIATTPFAAYHFNRVALYGIGSNLLAIPITAFCIMPFGLTALILMPIGLEQFALIPMGWGISALVWTAETTASLPFAHISVAAMGNAALILLVMAGLLICLSQFRYRKASLALSLCAIIIIATNQTPDILVTSNGKLHAIKLDNGQIAMSDLRYASYTRDKWLDRWGKADDGASLSAENIPCDGSGCSYQHINGQNIIFNRSAMALGEDCQRADILITPLDSPTVCTSPREIIDAPALKRNGAHALYVIKKTVKIETVRDHRGQRPWTVYGE